MRERIDFHYCHLLRRNVGQILLLTSVVLLGCAAARAESSELYVLGVHLHGIVLFDGQSNQVVGVIQTHGRSPKEIVPSPDGKFLYTTTDGRARLEVVNLQTRTVDREFNLAPSGYRLTIYGVTINRAGTTLYVHVKPVRELIDEYKVDPPQIWSVDIATGKTRKIAEVPQGVCALILPADEKRLLAWGRDLYTVDIATGKITSTYPLMNPVGPDQPALNTLPLFAQFERSGIFSIPYYTTDPVTKKDLFGLVNIDVDTGTVSKVELGAPIALYSAVVTPDRKHAYAIMNQLLDVDLEQKRLVNVIDLERTRYVINISPDGKKLYVSGASPYIHVYDAATLKLIATVDLPGDPAVTAFRALPAVR